MRSQHARGVRRDGARLRARPGAPEKRAEAPTPATHRLGLSDGRDGLLHVPAGADPARPIPLVVMLHGAGGEAGQSIPLLVQQAEQHDLLVLAPESRERSWDIISGRDYGPDIAYLERALDSVFGWFAVSRVAVAGFSDGASYALSVGLSNGDLFSDVLAFSPGFAAPDPVLGRPRIFISHGEHDRVLPVERCGRALSQRLKRAGYDVDYREFDGGHYVPRPLVGAAVRRFLS
jgi:phospholipase/carboxylesterase